MAETKKTPAKKKRATSKDLEVYKFGPKLGEMMAMANELAKSKIVPMAYIGNPAGVFAAIQYGSELGVPPMTSLQNVAVINGRPTLGADLSLGIAMRHPDWAGYSVKWDDKTEAAITTVRRRNKITGAIDEFTNTFSMADARRAGLVKPGGAYEKWPKRMLKHRATQFSLRDAFADVLHGLYDPSEMDPEYGASEELMMAAAEDNIEGAILDEKGILVETVKVTVDPAEKTKKKTTGKIR